MSELNRPLAPFSALLSYDLWRTALDRLCRQRLSLSLHDLSECPTRAAYDAGTGPALFFESTLIPQLRQEHGELVDELLTLAAEADVLADAPAPQDR